MTDVWMVLFGVGLGAVANPAAAQARHWLTSRNGELSGVWIQRIGAVGDRPERVDIVKVRHHPATRRLEGKIRRAKPKSESGKAWSFTGHLDGNDLVCAFSPQIQHPDQSSYGAIVLHRGGAGEPPFWSGVYYAPGNDNGRWPSQSNLRPTDLQWTIARSGRRWHPQSRLRRIVEAEA